MQNKSNAKRAVSRFETKLDPKSKTDQSYKNVCDINNIVSQFKKTGIIPESNKVPLYGDFSEIPKLEDMFDVVHNASKAFYALPSDLRKLLDNDPSRLEPWLLDDDNKEIARKYGLIEKAKLAPQAKQVTIKEKPAEKEQENATSKDGSTSSTN